jgi:hypothetical protein
LKRATTATSGVNKVRFEVEDMLMVADPCYVDKNDGPPEENWLVHTLPNAAGSWTAEVAISGPHVARLTARRSGAAPAIKWAIGEAGVDSGQMFVGCRTSYPLDYDALLAAWRGPKGERIDHQLLAFAQGAVCPSGDGDGEYPIEVGYDRAGRPVEVRVTFLPTAED